MVSYDTVSLHAVTPADHAQVIALALRPEQQAFIAPNDMSLAQAAENPACHPMLIRAAGLPVGFAMTALDPDDGNQWIYRFMIDHRHQGRGYGKQALNLLTQKIFSESGCLLIMLGVKPANTTATRLYERAGFHPAGFEFDGEHAYRLNRPASLGV